MKKLLFVLLPVFVMALSFSVAINTDVNADPDPCGDGYPDWDCCSPGPTYQGVSFLIDFEIVCDCNPPSNPCGCPLVCN